jgi:hypothetical protein
VSTRLRQTPANICVRCRCVIIGPVATVEVSRYSPVKGPDMTRYLHCGECADRLEQDLGRPPVPVDADGIPIRLRAATYATGP